MLRSLLVCCLLLLLGTVHAQYELRGTVTDKGTGETIIGAVVKLKGQDKGVSTDLDGKFVLKVAQLPPFTIVITSMGYAVQEIDVATLDQPISARMGPDEVMLKEALVVKERISDKQKQAPLTVETMDLLAIKEAPSGDFYESLGTLKGVDMTAASFGFKVINTRGFNSTSPVRSLQLIDGVDNASPGLNFSLGNFLGASDLDVQKVEVIAGASTAFYGPGAFNGVINMTTKSPWLFPGLSVSAKGGQRNMLEGAVRWAEVLKDKDGKARWAYKLNLFALRADDWQARNYGATVNSPTAVGNPGGFDAVNIYGDEDVTVNNNYLRSNLERRDYPGLGVFLRNGYREEDLVDYSTDNLKAGVSLHHKLTDSLEVIVASNYSRGSTVYQGDNRYRLKDVQFFQHRLELRREGKWFVRGYVTHEDAGKTYDIFTTGVRLQEAAGRTDEWNVPYTTLWGTWIRPQVEARPDYITTSEAVALGWNGTQWAAWQDQWIADNADFLSGLHQLVRDSVNGLNNVELDPFYAVGTQRFNDKFNEITGKRFTEGGSLFFDRSALMHGMGEYTFKPRFAQVKVGGNVRQYLPNSGGTIFRDTADVVIRNSEFGLFAGAEKKLMEERLTATATLRMDKNQNFKALLSPALSFVYSKTPAHVWRVSFSSAIRNPTLADQYLYYNVGRAILLGNVDGQFEAGRDSMFTVESFQEYRNTPNPITGLSKLDYFNVDRLRPEQVRSVEVGYRGTHWESVYLDASAYHSWYTDFIGYIIGLYGKFDQGIPSGGLQAFRLAANATSQVTTQGANLGLTWYRPKMTWTANYSYNKLTSGEDDPIIPAFNTPEHKVNAGFNTRERVIPGTDLKRLGYGVNWKWVQGYTFTGSPQFTGEIPTYDMVDAQVSVSFPKQHLTAKLGASNLFGLSPLFDANIPSDERMERAWDNGVTLVFGGPQVGRLAYLQLVYEWAKR
ncbi:MAG: carboxypeptidase-like regulatory domain-containing protein [Flavobacteriales bacterium]